MRNGRRLRSVTAVIVAVVALALGAGCDVEDNDFDTELDEVADETILGKGDGREIPRFVYGLEEKAASGLLDRMLLQEDMSFVRAELSACNRAAEPVCKRTLRQGSYRLSYGASSRLYVSFLDADGNSIDRFEYVSSGSRLRLRKTGSSRWFSMLATPCAQHSTDACAGGASSPVLDADGICIVGTECRECSAPSWSSPRPTASGRQSVISSNGTEIEFYPGSDAAVVEVKRVVAQLSCTPAFASLIPKTLIVVSPPGRGLEALPELFGAHAASEGVALSVDFGGRAGPAVAITYASITRWDEGLAHELLHLLAAQIGFPLATKIERAYAALPPAQNTDTQEHLFVYLAQYYLTGYGEYVRVQAPDVHAICLEFLGTARLWRGQPFDPNVANAITRIMRWYRTGLID